MAKCNSKSALSTLAETADEYIKLECARRRNQPLVRRRSMLQEQFQVSAPVSRLKARLAQTHHHEFLVRKENRAALVTIIDSVRDLVETTGSSLTARPGSVLAGDQRRSSAAASVGLNPMECARLLAWAGDTERLLAEFEPSDSRENDPIARVVEQLQQLQDGPVCLAEIVVDARALLERWDRAGAFEDQFHGASSDSDDEDDAGYVAGGSSSVLSARPTRTLDQSYAYQNVRQRAAANCIKRNVLRWVRAKESFCERVSEIELFGRTTESLLKELASTAGTAAALDMASDSPHDIFSVVRGRRVDRFANSIALADLLHFAKHVALFPVDQALRTLDDMARKRRLRGLRSAIKIQSTWRKARSVFQARRLFQAMEQLRIEREKEAAALAEALALAKTQTPTKSGKRKSTKPATGKKIRNSLALLGASAPSNDTPSEVKERSGSISVALTSRVRASMMVAKRKESKVVSVEKEAGGSHHGTPNSQRRRRTGEGDGNNDSKGEEDDPEDTSDVVNAWQAFLDSVQAQEQEDTATAIPEEAVAIATEEPAESPHGRDAGPEVVDALHSMYEDGWRNWSDEEDAALARSGFEPPSDDEKGPLAALQHVDRPDTHGSTSSRQCVPSGSTSREGSSRGSKASDMGTSRRRMAKQPLVVDQRRASRAFGSVVSTADLVKRLEQRPRMDRPSVLIPFSDWSAVQSSPPSATIADPTPATAASTPPGTAVRPPRHFHEMNFHQLYPGVEELHVVPTLADTGADKVDDAFATAAQIPQAARAIAYPPAVVSVNRAYRREQQQRQATAMLAVTKQAATTAYGDNHDAAETASNLSESEVAPSMALKPSRSTLRTHQGPGLRVYRAPASRDERGIVVIKRAAMPEAEDADAIQQKLVAHTQWMHTLDSDKTSAGSGSSLKVSIPPPNAAAPRPTIPRKRRLRAHPQQNNSLVHDGDSDLHSDPETPRPPRPTPTSTPALPRLRPSNVQLSPPSGVSAAKATTNASDPAPTSIMHEVRRTLKFKNNDVTAASARVPSDSATAPHSLPTSNSTEGSALNQPAGKVEGVRPSRPTASSEETVQMEHDIDGRFENRTNTISRRGSAGTRKWYLPRRVTTAQVSSSNPGLSEEERERRAATSRAKYGGQVYDERRRPGPRPGRGNAEVLFAAKPQGLKPTAKAPLGRQHVCQESLRDALRQSTDLAPSQSVSESPSALQPAISDAQSTPMTSTRLTRHRQAQVSAPANTFGNPMGVVPRPAVCVEASPHRPTPAAIDPERSAAFNKLLQQYLGLLQCSPASIHRTQRPADLE